jgi:D-galactosamine 6-phosphate deaminase/isomerase
MDALAKLLALPAAEKEARGLFHTPREISQQPATWREGYRRFVPIAPSVERFLDQAGLNDRNTRFSVLLAGAGSSDYIGQSLCALLQQQWRCDVKAVPSTDLLTSMDEYLVAGNQYLWISFSRSGDSSEGVEVLRSALSRYSAIHHIVVTCNQHGQMASLFAGHSNLLSLVLDDQVNDRGLAMTSSFSNMILTGQSLAHVREMNRYTPILEELAATAQRILPEAADVCARMVADGFSKVCFLGSGPLKAAAIESALKVLELTAGRVISFAESFLGLRHGPLSAIDSETLIVGFLSGDARRRAFELDLLQEICDKQLTAKCLAVLPTESESSAAQVAKNTLILPFSREITDLYRPPLDAIVGQLLGLFASVEHGLKPDSPSPQGAISRVVSHVRIH